MRGPGGKVVEPFAVAQVDGILTPPKNGEFCVSRWSKLPWCSLVQQSRMVVLVSIYETSRSI